MACGSLIYIDCCRGAVDLPVPGEGDASGAGAFNHFTGFANFASHVNITVTGASNDEIVMAGIARHLLFEADELYLVVGDAFAPGETGNNEEPAGQGCQYLHDQGLVGPPREGFGVQILDLPVTHATQRHEKTPRDPGVSLLQAEIQV